jgi:hypothetical protein
LGDKIRPPVPSANVFITSLREVKLIIQDLSTKGKKYGVKRDWDIVALCFVNS